MSLRAWLSSSPRSRRVVIVLLNTSLVILANYAAFWLRFDARIPDEYYTAWVQGLTALVLIRMVTFIHFRLSEGLWRYTGIHDLRNIATGVVSSTLALYAWNIAAGVAPYPKSIYFIDSILLIFSMGGVRLSRRLYREFAQTGRKKRVLIYGAGDAGEMIVRDMRNNPSYDEEPVGFIDDNVHKVGERIHGVPVMGTQDNLRAILMKTRASEILIAMPGANPATLRKLVQTLETFKIPIKTLPNIRDIITGKVTVNQIRSLMIEDLLPRSPVGLDSPSVRNLICDRNVLVTGAGGSIGSELARQIASMNPAQLILFERYENTLHDVAHELSVSHPALRIHAVIGDVTDAIRVSEVMRSYEPNIVFHAAAHKHVPLMEDSPCEAIKNNVGGTRTLANAAERHGVSTFVLISTDKAVNPSSIMGASKRIGELMIQSRAGSATDFMAVRFGNVLGSNGSVIPRFLSQIKQGGPVTVTHPEMTRYFMLIPEAVQLVLHAAAMSDSGSIYVLDMGQEFKVLELARNLIRLCGFVPEEEIPITFIGLRPGEKLSEELVDPGETVTTSMMDRISRIQSRVVSLNQSQLDSKVNELCRRALMSDVDGVLSLVSALVPTFKADRRLHALAESSRDSAIA